MVSHFFAYLSKLRWIIRWGLKRNLTSENVMEHSWEVATIAHALALLRRRRDPSIDPNAVATAALYHDCSEVITGDLPSPIKYHSKAIQQAYHSIERDAQLELLGLLPEELRADYEAVMLEERIPSAWHELIKAADTISAYLKCQSELAAGNREFETAAEDIRRRLDCYELPEVAYFMRTFVPSYSLTLDQLLVRQSDQN